MIILAIGVVAFAVFHLVPAFPEAKAVAKARVGERLYGPIFGALSAAALVLIVWGWRVSGFIPVYEPPVWGRYLNFGLTALAFLCLGIFIFRGALRQKLRFPLAVGVTLWATGHLLANGDLAGLILFGGLLTYAVISIAAGIANKVRPSPEVRSGHDALAILAGMARAMTQLHPVLIGIPILPLS
jgi:uncharacterized membrane protein